MKLSGFCLLLATSACTLCLAQDDPITARTATITVLTKAYGSGGATACSAFQAKSIMNSVTQTLNIGSQSSGAGAGKITFNPLTIAKNVDNCSPLLFFRAASGTPLSELIAIVEPPAPNAASPKKEPVFLIRLGLAAIQSLNDSAADGTAILEVVNFEYADLTIAQWDPVTRATSCSGWDRSRNAEDTSHCSELTGIAIDRNNGKAR